MAGFVYVLLNPGLAGQVKIGRTDRHPNDRARELTTTGLPHPFVAAYWKVVSDPVAVEADLHRRFEAHRVNQNREFFAIDVVKVIDAIAAYQDSELEEFDDMPARVAPYLYWMAVEGQGHFFRIGVSDLPKHDLHAIASEDAQERWPRHFLTFGRPRFFDLESRQMGDEILKQLQDRASPGMEGMYNDVDIDEISRTHSNYAVRRFEREAQAERERAAIRAQAISRRL